MRYLAFCAALLLLSFFAQEFVPVIMWAYAARLLLVHTVFYCIALTVPFPVMLFFAAIAGFCWDARFHVPVPPLDAITPGLLHSELPFGFSMFLFALLGSVIQGVRPIFRKGRWELPIVLVSLSIALGILIELLLISFQRGEWAAPAEFWWKLLLTAMFSALLSPFLLLLLSRVANRMRFRLWVEGLQRRQRYDGEAL